MNRRQFLFGGVAATGVLASCTPYSPVAGGSTAPASRTAGVITDAIFTALERQIIRDYYRSTLPPGLARRETLPPGLRRQLVRNGRLPPGLEKRALPPDLIARLPRRDDRYEMVRVGTDILLILIATGVILDIIENAPA